MAVWYRRARSCSDLIRCGRRPAVSLLMFALSLGVVSSPPAAGQTDRPIASPAADAFCHVYVVKIADGEPQDLRASCRGRGLMLGQTSGYEVLISDKLQATLVDTRLGSERRILLITFLDDGEPLVEDITADLALAAGRGVMSELDGLEINTSRYASDGEIAVVPVTRASSTDMTGKVNIGQNIAAERARRRGARAQD